MLRSRIFLFLILMFLSLSSCASFYYSLAIERNDKSVILEPVNEFLSDIETDDSFFGKNKDWLKKQDFLRLEIVTEDNLKLKAYWLPKLDNNSCTSKNTVILLHGYAFDAFFMSPFAKVYNEDFGFNVLSVDARGHGESEGDYIGFGWHERLDVIDWSKEIIKLIGGDCSIVIHGISMGGSTAIMVSGEKLPDQIKCIVEDCGYTSVWDIFDYQLKHFRNLENNYSLLKSVSEFTEKRVGYSFKEASALKQVAKAEIPILFIHGGEDNFVPTEMVYRLYDACPSKKDLFIVEGADHGCSAVIAKEEYQKKLENFLRSCGFYF